MSSIREPQNHRMVWDGRALKDYLFSSPLPWAQTSFPKIGCSKLNNSKFSVVGRNIHKYLSNEKSIRKFEPCPPLHPRCICLNQVCSVSRKILYLSVFSHVNSTNFNDVLVSWWKMSCQGNVSNLGKGVPFAKPNNRHNHLTGKC